MLLSNLTRLVRKLTARRPVILLVGAHPDDITYAAGGLAALATLLGFRVIEIIATDGQAGSQDEARWSSDRIGKIRRREQLQANRILSISRTIFLGYQDGRLHAAERLTARLRRLMRWYQPLLVVTYGPDGLTGHRDHQEISRATTQAFQDACLADSLLWYIAASPDWQEHIRPLLEAANAMYGDEYPHVFDPSELIVLDLSVLAHILALKIQAILAHASQSGPLHNALEEFGGLDALIEKWFSQETFRPAPARSFVVA